MTFFRNKFQIWFGLLKWAGVAGNVRSRTPGWWSDLGETRWRGRRRWSRTRWSRTRWSSTRWSRTRWSRTRWSRTSWLGWDAPSAIQAQTSAAVLPVPPVAKPLHLPQSVDISWMSRKWVGSFVVTNLQFFEPKTNLVTDLNRSICSIPSSSHEVCWPGPSNLRNFNPGRDVWYDKPQKIPGIYFPKSQDRDLNSIPGSRWSLMLTCFIKTAGLRLTSFYQTRKYIL